MGDVKEECVSHVRMLLYLVVMAVSLMAACTERDRLSDRIDALEADTTEVTCPTS